MTEEEKKIEEHRQRHIALHQALDELVADWIMQTDKRPSANTVLELMQWSNEQTRWPTDRRSMNIPGEN